MDAGVGIQYRMVRLGTMLAAVLAAWVLAPVAGAFDDAPAVRAAVLRASDLILDLDLDRAEGECRHLLDLPQGEAAGRFCLGLVTLARAEEADDPVPELDRFLAEIAEAVRAAEALERAYPADAEVTLLLGLVHGSKALADGAHKNYLAAWQALRDGHRRFQEALRLDPALVDAYYGIGLYNFALGRLPALLRPLVTIVLPPGDAAQGLQDVERVAEQGTYLKMTARVALLRLYAGQEEKYAEAWRLGQDLLPRYPGNPDLYFATAHAASELGRFSEALEIARRVGRHLAEGRPHFGGDLAARHQQLMGKIYMDRGEYATALTFFRRAIEAPTPPRYRWVTAWAWTRSGMIYDLTGDRNEAVRRYREALRVQTEGLAKDLARQYLEVPYRGRSRVRS
jgi:tetratricopeptide (TPR) repeat protein